MSDLIDTVAEAIRQAQFEWAYEEDLAIVQAKAAVAVVLRDMASQELAKESQLSPCCPFHFIRSYARENGVSLDDR